MRSQNLERLRAGVSNMANVPLFKKEQAITDLVGLLIDHLEAQDGHLSDLNGEVEMLRRKVSDIEGRV